MNTYESRIWLERETTLALASADLIDAYEVDELYWSNLRQGQDTEQAEASGYLAGYRDAVAACREVLNGRPEVLASYVGEARDVAAEQTAELAEELPDLAR